MRRNILSELGSKCVRFIYVLCETIESTDFKLFVKFYTTYVVPIISYASVLYSSSSVKPEENYWKTPKSFHQKAIYENLSEETRSMLFSKIIDLLSFLVEISMSKELA